MAKRSKRPKQKKSESIITTSPEPETRRGMWNTPEPTVRERRTIQSTQQHGSTDESEDDLPAAPPPSADERYQRSRASPAEEEAEDSSEIEIVEDLHPVTPKKSKEKSSLLTPKAKRGDLVTPTRHAFTTDLASSKRTHKPKATDEKGSDLETQVDLKSQTFETANAAQHVVATKRVSKPSAKAAYMKEQEIESYEPSSTDDSLPLPEDIFKTSTKRSKQNRSNTTVQNVTDPRTPQSKRRHETPPHLDSDMDASPTPSPSKKQRTRDNVAQGTPIRPKSSRGIHNVHNEVNEPPSPLTPPVEGTARKAAQHSRGSASKKTVRNDSDISWSPSEYEVTSKSSSKACPQSEAFPDPSPFVDRGYPPCAIQSFSSTLYEAQTQMGQASMELSLPMYQAIVDVLERGIPLRNFINAVNFVKTATVMNPARASTNEIGINKDSRIVPAGTGSSSFIPPMICVSTGLVATCNLIDPGQSGFGANRHLVKKIGIWLLNEEFDRMMAFFGKAYDVDNFYANWFNDALHFQSQREGAGTYGKKGPPGNNTSPKKPSGLFGVRTPAKKSQDKVDVTFPPFIKFTDDVPIYDIRQHRFDFTATDFANLRTLPLYHLGLRDLPHNAIVTVGYAVNMYPYTQNDPPPGSLSLSLNILFVLLHGEITDDGSGTSHLPGNVKKPTMKTVDSDEN